MYSMSFQILMYRIFAAHKEEVEETKSHRKRCFEDSNAEISNKHSKIYHQESLAHSSKNAEKQTGYMKREVNEESAILTKKVKF